MLKCGDEPELVRVSKFRTSSSLKRKQSVRCSRRLKHARPSRRKELDRNKSCTADRGGPLPLQMDGNVECDGVGTRSLTDQKQGKVSKLFGKTTHIISRILFQKPSQIPSNPILRKDTEGSAMRRHSQVYQVTPLKPIENRSDDEKSTRTEETDLDELDSQHSSCLELNQNELDHEKELQKLQLWGEHIRFVVLNDNSSTEDRLASCLMVSCVCVNLSDHSVIQLLFKQLEHPISSLD